MDEGIFLFAAGEKREIFEIRKGDETKVIRIFKGEVHAMLAISDVSYVVYKTPEDENIICCKGPNLKTELKRMRQVVAKALLERRKKDEKEKKPICSLCRS